MDIHDIIIKDANAHVLKVTGQNGQAVGQFDVPKTDQTDTFGFSNDDGAVQAGNPVSPRFVDLGDNTILDRATNRQWVKRPELIIPDGLRTDNVGQEKGDYVQGATYHPGDIVTDPSDSSAWICLTTNTTTDADFATERSDYGSNWTSTIWATSNGAGGVNPVGMVWDSSQGSPDALSACVGLTKSGKNDWKLPNVKELVSIVNYGRGGDGSNAAIDPTFFPNTILDGYWTSSVYAGYSYFAWVVSFVGGSVYSSYCGSYYYVRPVRQY